MTFLGTFVKIRLHPLLDTKGKKFQYLAVHFISCQMSSTQSPPQTSLPALSDPSSSSLFNPFFDKSCKFDLDFPTNVPSYLSLYFLLPTDRGASLYPEKFCFRSMVLLTTYTLCFVINMHLLSCPFQTVFQSLPAAVQNLNHTTRASPF